MFNEMLAAVAAPTHPRSLSALGRFLAFGAAAGVVAAAAAHVSTLAAVPVWAMFMGWIAWFTRGHSARDGLINWICLALGIGIGFGATALLGLLAPALGVFALPFVVFAVAILVVSARILPALSNIPSYFLGVVSVFAAHAAPTLAAFAELGGASAVGSLAAWLASAVQARIVRHA
ncbi:hypothetical protein GGC65_002286 [Sphingopyxis sp. OAS728]|uniref:DUF1097 domain-containing protein n=1 Tax=Sphingopyxis sp. OAS728 TaxID=2663823 RepID=UPI001A0D0AC8|nr:DUF1097 domain-containing protein [Sphingopyxis sp. OAS728]MBE1527830.1 hypothetical protein [Sphingopyxis sp. OAS728]